MNATVQQRRRAMAQHVQGPEQAAGLAAALVVVGDHMVVRGEAQGRQRAAQLRCLGKKPAHGIAARDHARVLETHRTRHLCGRGSLRFAQVDDKQIFRTQ